MQYLDQNNNLLISALTEENPFISTSEIINWLKLSNEKVSVQIKKISFEELDQWYFEKKNGNLCHKSGKFFSIDGIHINTNWGLIQQWEQPIINQPEIGFLGIITKEFNGILYFLMQAKIEPGNVNSVQLSPTLQATKSNYTQIHHGKKPLYLDYFQKISNYQIILDQLQSEQGARFIKKRNRNIIIKVQEEIKVYENFVWLTLGQIKKLMQFDNLVNMDTRTVISGISFDGAGMEMLNGNAYLRSIFETQKSINNFDSIIHWVTGIKSKYDLVVTKVTLKNLENWKITENEIEHFEKKFFKVIATKVVISNREVQTWSQPLIEPAQEGLIAFVVKEINGVIHFLVQAKMECGNFDIIEFAPTVQCLTGNYKTTPKGTLPYLEYVLNAKNEQITMDTYQSEEGGRFYHEQNRNMIVVAEKEFNEELPENFIWMTLHQLLTFIKFNNYINIQARSLIAAISFTS